MTIQRIKELIAPSQADLVSKILSKHGQLCNVKYSRPLKLLKNYKDSRGFKHVSGVYRLGIDYNQLKSVQQKKLNGELPEETHDMLGREWLVWPYLMRTKTDKILVRLYTMRNAYKETSYELDGNLVELNELKGICAASEFNTEPDLDCFDISLDYIREITP